jgi:hypothetical protein
MAHGCRIYSGGTSAVAPYVALGSRSESALGYTDLMIRGFFDAMHVSRQVVDGWNTSDLVHTINISCRIKAHICRLARNHQITITIQK